jgi:NAD(P)-dependent dehydrogenase (short-subunit alcohol dehydrogenase family)
MTNKQVWLITGAGRGMGLYIAKAALAAGHKLAQALLKLAGQNELPRRFIAGADAVGTAEQKIVLLQKQIAAHRELSTSLAYEGA